MTPKNITEQDKQVAQATKSNPERGGAFYFPVQQNRQRKRDESVSCIADDHSIEDGETVEHNPARIKVVMVGVRVHFDQVFARVKGSLIGKQNRDALAFVGVFAEMAKCKPFTYSLDQFILRDGSPASKHKEPVVQGRVQY